VGASVQLTTASRGVFISGSNGSNARYIMFRGSVKSTGYPLHLPVSPYFPSHALPYTITFQLDSTMCSIHTCIIFVFSLVFAWIEYPFSHSFLNPLCSHKKGSDHLDMLLYTEISYKSSVARLQDEFKNIYIYIKCNSLCVNHGSSYCCVVDQLLNIKHVTTAFVHIQSVLLYCCIYIF
jgi:hypothetical protein